ncbi:PilT/PilU family type 4a pilus ATPase [Candidatus Dojkabacteria bacterium]|uniref:PilT/PilU family type 4a pilus ATPase n=1 Tax=Candidatus Dojkabacteria bacterium TaxID=2099670 RepID=A0A955L0T8_9BACT|nr:PilT/PilU family type 4a pilus ATPase [Candidatus Dojkabacteria bacterium]
MQNTVLPQNNNVREYSGPPLPRSNALFNDIDYQLSTDFRDAVLQPSSAGNASTQTLDTPPSANDVSVAQTQQPITQPTLPENPQLNYTPIQPVPSQSEQSQPPVTPQVSQVYKPAQENKVILGSNITNFNSINDLLSLAVDKGASDLHISVGYPPLLRINGDLLPVPSQVLTQEKVSQLFTEILQENQKKQLMNYLDIDFSYTHTTGNRFRINIFHKQGQLAGAFRLIPSKIRTITDLGMPSILQDFTTVANGLVLITGPTGSGKSTTIASVIQEINLTQARHIITIEDPVEYLFPRAKALVNQREVGKDVRSWTRGLREILREDPDVVLVGEMRDYETIALTITAAETGHLVFSTLHTNSASQTIDRIIDVFPDVQQAQIRAQLANVIHAVVSQRLIPLKSGGRKAVCEIMIATPAIRNAIREKKTYQIDNMIQTSSELGMISLEKSLVNLIRSGEITLDEAQAYTVKHNDLISLLKQN